MGPELGEFIAGIRSEGGPACVHDNDVRWLYASRSSVWKGDDSSLVVKCFSPEDAIDSPVFGEKKTSTKLKVTTQKPNRTTLRNRFRTTTKRPNQSTRTPSVDCEWSDFGEWTQCSASCNTGIQSRFRTITRQASNGGRRCLGARQESRTCNNQPCNALTTTTTTRRPRPTTTTRRPRPQDNTTRRPRPRDERVQCHTCGSLFSTDAPDCPNFNSRDTSQQKTCGAGEACLWYSYQKSSTEIAIVRECFSTSVLLGSITDPIVPSDQCVPKPVEDASIMACICTNDFCNGMDGGESAIRSTPRPSLFDRTSTKRPGGISARPPPRTPAPRPPPRNPAPSPRRPGEGVLCHSCGSLFGQEECPDFDPANPSHQKRCSPGEACLWYSWQKSSAEVAMVRECFSPSILLGPISNPLTKKSTCIPQDIAETPGSRYDQRLIRIYSTRS